MNRKELRKLFVKETGKKWFSGAKYRRWIEDLVISTKIAEPTTKGLKNADFDGLRLIVERVNECDYIAVGRTVAVLKTLLEKLEPAKEAPKLIDQELFKKAAEAAESLSKQMKEFRNIQIKIPNVQGVRGCVNIESMAEQPKESETITLNKETAEQLRLLINNLINGKKPYYKKQKDAFKILEKKCF